jgi:hypothetical protein
LTEDYSTSVIQGRIKSRIQQILSNPKHARIFHWGRLITITGGAQALIQGLGIICGILVLWLLPTREYAWYTVVNTMLGTMIILADSGVYIGVMSEGAKVWQDKNKLGTVIATGLHLRKKFAIGSLSVSIPILVILLSRHGANWMTILLISASLVPVFYASLSDSLLEVVPKLHQDITSLQKNQVSVSLGRLLITTLTLFIFPFAYVAVLANGIPRMLGNIRMYKIAHAFADKNQKADANIKNKILKVVKRSMPENIYYCLSGQITIWLISIFGNTKSVAEVGALGRLSLALNIFTIILSTVVIPRYAKLLENKVILLKRQFQIFTCMVIVCVLIIVITWLAPRQILMILGKNYENIDIQLLFLSMYGSCMNLLVSSIYFMYTSRGWIINPILSISVSILSTLAAFFLFDISSIKGVLLLNIFVSFIQLVFQGGFSIRKILKVS